MPHIPKSTPFKHETTREKRRRMWNFECNRKGRSLLDLLMQGNYQPPSIPNRPLQESSFDGNAPGDEDQWEDTDDREDPHNKPAGRNNNSDNLYSTWDSIPWNAIAPTKPSRFLPLLNPDIMASIQAHNRQAVHHTRANNWLKVMTKLFSAYLWLKEKTNNWTAENSFDSFTTRFCKCDAAALRSRVSVDEVGQS
ncbi:hypothetical protein PCASD_09881 [Puccinia coronata f. sp. avenae]|uniref:Uncharacterized protein n=1 Tax=Puccinia coronata f. sp. avenae TaxID=200324 RepID=A0A2N5UI31_9BASI|nr:hypothetical protein PCASD_09881 [Puccinia coronata f. sp. avenae]